MFDCVSIGDAVMDVFLTVHDANVLCKKDDKECEICLRYGEKIPVDRLDRSIGGNAINNAVGLSRLGFKTSLFSVHGDDENGRVIDQVLDQEGVDRSLVIRQENTSSRYSTIINFKSERTILEYNVPHQYHMPHDVPQTKWMYVSSVGHHYEDFLGALATHIKEKNIRLGFTPNNAQLNSPLESYLPLVQECSILFANLEEAKKMVGEGNIKNLLSNIYELGPRIVAITDGHQGSYVYDGNRYLHLGILGNKVVSATGAGDAYASGFMGAIMKELPVSTAMTWGTFNASSVVSKIGAQSGLLNFEAIEKLTKENSHFSPSEI